MHAVGVTEFGGPEALHVVELSEPHAGPGEVRIRVRGAAVNPTDTFVRNGARANQQATVPPPYVPGMDAAGVLDERGEGVTTDLIIGDHVMAIVLPAGSRGAYAELIVVPAESVARVPTGVSDAEASTLPMNGLTARQALDLLGLEPGQTLAVTGAAGAVGGYVVQLARSEGIRVIADASLEDEPLVEELGADIVVARGDDIAARIRAKAPDGVDALVDCAVQGELILPAVKDGGRVAAVRPFTGDTERDIAVHQVWVRNYAREQTKLEELGRLVEQGKITLRVARRFPADRAAEAHRILEAGGTRGRLVLEF
jgi:NADPH:quinone reductase-like Zn-dependent oxidoreductase